MPRKPRIEYAGAVYHVMSRGNRQELIFLDTSDCISFLKTLDEVCERTGWCIHAYVLMGNHYHLLLETPEPNLVAGMKWLQGTYTQRFNIRHKTCGHVLQGRYKALIVDSEDHYFSTVAHYIHLNPARAHSFDLENGKLSDYRWSSYPGYISSQKRPSWLTVDRLFDNLCLNNDSSGRRKFKTIMQERVIEISRNANRGDIDERWKRIRRGWYFGGDAFRDLLLDKLGGLTGQRASFSGEAVRTHDEKEAERLFQAGLKILELAEANLLELRKGATEKCILAWLIRKNTAVSNQWISERLQMGRPDCFSRYPRRIEAAQDRQVMLMKRKLIESTRLRD